MVKKVLLLLIDIALYAFFISSIKSDFIFVFGGLFVLFLPALYMAFREDRKLVWKKTFDRYTRPILRFVILFISLYFQIFHAENIGDFEVLQKYSGAKPLESFLGLLFHLVCAFFLALYTVTLLFDFFNLFRTKNDPPDVLFNSIKKN
jgi:succinate dehydrogenase hydrophobic anchor subunit